jgi:hypothetical protein
MSADFPTHSEIGEQNVRAYLRRNMDERVLFGRREPMRNQEREKAGVML